MNPYRIFAVLCCLAISVIPALGAVVPGKRISDYTQTLTVGDAWIYEIAVPGVTNYKVTFGTMATNIIARAGGGGSSTNAQPPSATLTNLANNPYKGYTNGGLAGPISSVQFNSNGVMQGGAGFTFTNGNVVIGTNARPASVNPLTIAGTNGGGIVIQHTNANLAFEIGNALHYTTAVPFIRPLTNGGIAFDLIPNGPAATWIDICSTDFRTNSTGGEYLHLEKELNGAGIVGCSAFGGGTIRDLKLGYYGGNIQFGPTGSSATFQPNVIANFEFPTANYYQSEVNFVQYPSGPTGNKMLFGYVESGIAYRSAIEWTNTSGGQRTGLILVKTGGTVGITTASPTNTLDVNGSTSLRSNLFLPNLPTNGSPIAFLAVDAGGAVYETASISISTQMVTAAIGTLTLTNALSLTVLNVGTMNLTNALGSNQVRHGYQDLTNIIRRQTFFAPAGYMISNSTDGALFSTLESSPPTNRMSDRYTFSGVVTNVVGFDTVMPLNWDLGTVKVKLWTISTNNLATTTNVWAISAVAIQHGSMFTNVNWGTEVTWKNVVSSAGGQELLTPASTAVTAGNSPAAAGNHVYFRIRRLPGHADDNDGGEQNLLGAWVQYGETMSEVSSW